MSNAIALMIQGFINSAVQLSARVMRASCGAVQRAAADYIMQAF